VFANRSREITNIVQDVTEPIQLGTLAQKQIAVIDGQCATLERSRHDLLARRKELLQAERALSGLKSLTTTLDRECDAAQLPGSEHATLTGIYDVFHRHACGRAFKRYVEAGSRSAPCTNCGTPKPTRVDEALLPRSIV